MSALQRRFGKLVASRRREMGLTQPALAELTHQTKDMVAKIEAGRTGVSFENIEAIAEALDVEPAALFSAEVLASSFKGGAKRRIMEKLATLTEPDLIWAERLLEVALTPRRQEAPLDKVRIKTRAVRTMVKGRKS